VAFAVGEEVLLKPSSAFSHVSSHILRDASAEVGSRFTKSLF